jgi:hypothetical protein
MKRIVASPQQGETGPGGERDRVHVDVMSRGFGRLRQTGLGPVGGPTAGLRATPWGSVRRGRSPSWPRDAHAPRTISATGSCQARAWGVAAVPETTFRRRARRASTPRPKPDSDPVPHRVLANPHLCPDVTMPAPTSTFGGATSVRAWPPVVVRRPAPPSVRQRASSVLPVTHDQPDPTAPDRCLFSKVLT